MAGRDTEDGDENGGLGSGRLLMVAVLALAVASTAVLVLADNTTWLRMGVLASLWAALLGVFLAAKFRKQVGERENEVADLQSVYELELEREVAARREYELEVEAEARKRVEEASHADLAELRTELRALRESLERLTGGEVLVERFALRAQSTRMRALADGQTRVVAADNPRRSISASQPVPRQVDAATELIAHAATQSAQAGGQRGATQAGGQRGAAQSVQAGGQQVRREAPRRETQRPGGYRPEPSRPQTPRDGAVADEPRREAPAVGVPPQARPNWPDQRHQQTPAPGRRPVPVRVQQAQARPPQARAAQPAVVPQPPPSQQKPPPPPPQQQATRVAEPVRPPVHREPPPPRPPGPPPDVERHAGWPPPSRSETSRPDFARPEPAAHHAVDRTRRAEPVDRSRHRVPDPPPADPDPSPGGRRRAEERPSDWQAYREWRAREESQQPQQQSQQPPQPPAQQHGGWQTDPETTGAHTAGRSVTELLAAHGSHDTPRHHRRRAD